MRTLRPSSKLGRTTLWLGGLSILFIVLRWSPVLPQGQSDWRVNSPSPTTLLMAIVHAFVRAYSLEAGMVLTPLALRVGALSNGDPRMYYRGDGITQSPLAPGMLMTTLNY